MEGRAQGPFESNGVSGARQAQQQIRIHREPASTSGEAQPSLPVTYLHICNSTWQRGLSQEWGEACESQHSPRGRGMLQEAWPNNNQGALQSLQRAQIWKGVVTLIKCLDL